MHEVATHIYIQLFYCLQSKNVSTTANYLLLLLQIGVPMHSPKMMAVRMASMMTMMMTGMMTAITILSFQFFFCRNERQGRGEQTDTLTRGEVLHEEKGINQTFCDGCVIMQHLPFP